MSNLGWFECADIRGVPDIWTPSRIPTALWLDAADLNLSTLVGNNVSVWKDKSGNGRDAIQGTDVNRPQANYLTVNGRRVFNFDGADTMLTSDIFTTACDVSIFVVAKRTDTIERGIFAIQNGLNNTNGFFHFIQRSDLTNYGRSLFSSDGNTGNLSIMYPPVQFVNSEFIISGHGKSDTKHFLSWNGNFSEVVSGVRCNFISAKGVIGAFYSTAYNFLGTIAEILVLPVYVSSTTHDRVIGYLAHKWGLS